jgi:hypothetical protein
MTIGPTPWPEDTTPQEESRVITYEELHTLEDRTAVRVTVVRSARAMRLSSPTAMPPGNWPPRTMGQRELALQSDCDIAQCDSCDRVGPCVSGDEGDFCEPGYGCRADCPCQCCSGAGYIEIETESDLGQLRASTRDCPECTEET